MQGWSVNEQAKEEHKHLTLEYIRDDELECFTGIVQSVITRTVTQASTSNHHTAISTTESLDVFVKCSDGVERLCRPSDRVLVSTGHEVSVVNVKTKEGPQLLYLANHTTRHEYRPRYKGGSLLMKLGAACLIVSLPSWLAGHFLLPSSWTNSLINSQLGNTVLLACGGFLVVMLVKWMVQADNETCQRVRTLVLDCSAGARKQELSP
jgi:hypothetical protein